MSLPDIFSEKNLVLTRISEKNDGGLPDRQRYSLLMGKYICKWYVQKRHNIQNTFKNVYNSTPKISDLKWAEGSLGGSMG